MVLILCQIPLCMSLTLVRCTMMIETSNYYVSRNSPGNDILFYSLSEKNVFQNQDIIEISIKLHVVITFNTVVIVSCKG